MSVDLSSDDVSCASSSTTEVATSDDIPEKVNVLEGGPAVPKSGTSQMEFEWDGNIADPIQLFIDEHLAKVVSKFPIRNKSNRKSIALKPTLRVLCTSLDLVKEGKKEMLVQRIVVYFLSNPSELDAYPHFKDFTVFKDTSQKWKTAKSHYELESQFHKELLQEEGFDPTVYFDSSKTLRVSFLKLCLLGKERQKFSPCFPDGKAAYINCFGVKYDVAHIERHLKETTDSQLSRWTVADGGKKTSRDINVRTPDCLFRLINILMLDDEVYGRLLAESKSQPTNRRSLDTGKKGNSSFWNDV